jgi:hypothetical protein
LLDALACSNLATWCPSWGKSPWLVMVTTTTPRSSLPCHCQPLALLLPLHHVPLAFLHAVALLPWQACHSLPSISSPAPCPHCISCHPPRIKTTMGSRKKTERCHSKDCHYGISIPCLTFWVNNHMNESFFSW